MMLVGKNYFTSADVSMIGYMDVVTLDTYLTIDHKIEDNETHHIHNQAKNISRSEKLHHITF